MSDIQFADYPDWVRIDTSILPTPFIASGDVDMSNNAVLGRYYVEPWESVQFSLSNPTSFTRLEALWYTAELGGQEVGRRILDTEASNWSVWTWQNHGSWLTLIFRTIAAGAQDGNLYCAGSRRRAGTAETLGIPVRLQTTASLIGPGATGTVAGGNVFEGRASIFFDTTATASTLELQFTEYDSAGVWTPFYRLENDSVQHNVDVEIPPFPIRAQFTNNDAVNRTYSLNVRPHALIG